MMHRTATTRRLTGIIGATVVAAAVGAGASAIGQSPTGTAATVAAIERQAESDPEAALAAWRGLIAREGSAWPATPEELDAELRLRPALNRAASALGDPERREAAGQEVAAEQERRVRRFLSEATTPESVQAGISALPVLGIDPETLDPRARYNVRLHGLKRAVASGGLRDEDARRAAGEFAAWARGLPGGVGYLGAASRTLAGLEEIARGEEERTAPPTDAATLGPGATGRYRGRAEGDLLRFEPLDGRGSVLEFALVDGSGAPETGPFYIGTTEVSVGAFADLVLGRPGARAALKEVLLDFGPLDDPRRGLRAWEWSEEGDRIVPARSWFTRWGGGSESPESQAWRAPAPADPMQQLSPEAALYAAAAAGARLPTVDEWRAAVERFGRGEPEFGPADEPFWPVPAGRGPVRHLAGNVAEYATRTPLDASAMLSPRSAAARELMREQAGAFWIVGGSVLSGPDAAAARPVDLVLAREGYADVGFRLAFSAPAREAASAAAAIDRFLTPTPYLRPR